ncbi:MAG: signal peptide peptidase SppA, partial [Bacteroidetes bacterium]|nr:signal peptide peptidase SppA [Bacteroidota bacterium]
VHGGFETALKLAAAKAKISKYRVVEYPENKFSLSALFGNLGNVDVSIRQALGANYELYRRAVQAEQVKGIQMRLPFDISVQ